jgi:acyl-CoA-dependent ceramide synthase
MPYGTYSLTQTTLESFNDSHGVSGLRLSQDGGNEAFKHIYQPFFYPGADTVSFNPKIRWSFLGLLLGLQCITLMWFTMIVRVVIQVLCGQGAGDTRSDDEGEEEESEASPVQPSKPTSIPFSAPPEKLRYIEVETNSTEYVRRTPSSSGGGSRRSRKGNAFASGLNLGEHKEILNRIGCLSEEQLAREREKKGGRER